MKIIVQQNNLEQLIDTARVLVDEAKLHINKHEAWIRAVDPANVAMVESYLHAEAAEAWDVDEEHLLGINLSRIDDIISMADSDDLIQLDLEAERGYLHIEFGGLEYTLALIDPDSIRQEPDIPDLDLPAHMTIEGADLTRAVRSADMVSDHFDIIVDPDGGLTEDGTRAMQFKASGDTDDVDYTLIPEEILNAEWGTARSKFSLDYFKSIRKAIPDDVELTMELGEEYPTIMSFDWSDDRGRTTYMVAPRISKD